jgi:hypothetical protein
MQSLMLYLLETRCKICRNDVREQAASAERGTYPALTGYFWRVEEHTLTLLRKATMR